MRDFDADTAAWDVAESSFPSDGTLTDKAAFLVSYAVLAPSSHNSQPWRFSIPGWSRDGGATMEKTMQTIVVRRDESRRLPVADESRRELYISLGCAIENLLVAASHFGLGASAELADSMDEDVAAVVILKPDAEPSPDGVPEPERASLFEALTARRTHRTPFRDELLDTRILDALRDTVIEPDIAVQLIVDDETKDAIADLQAIADERLMANPRYRAELGEWLGSGALGDSWPKARISEFVVRYFDLGEREGANNAALLRAAPCICVLGAADEAVYTTIRVGQAFQRLALRVTMLGLATHPLSQILESAKQRRELQVLLKSEDEIPMHLFRIGHPTDTPDPTPRRGIDEVLVEDGATS